MKKQTAVEWMVSQLPPIQQEGLRDIIEQANVMFERQIIEAWIVTDNKLQRDAAKKYFTETYGELKNKNNG